MIWQSIDDIFVIFSLFNKVFTEISKWLMLDKLRITSINFKLGTKVKSYTNIMNHFGNKTKILYIKHHILAFTRKNLNFGSGWSWMGWTKSWLGSSIRWHFPPQKKKRKSRLPPIPTTTISLQIPTQLLRRSAPKGFSEPAMALISSSQTLTLRSTSPTLSLPSHPSHFAISQSPPNNPHSLSLFYSPKSTTQFSARRLIVPRASSTESTAVDFNPSIGEILGDVSIFTAAGDSVQFKDLLVPNEVTFLLLPSQISLIFLKLLIGFVYVILISSGVTFFC